MIGIQPVHTNDQDKLLQQDLLIAQVESVAELRVALSCFVSGNGSNDKLDHI